MIFRTEINLEPSGVNVSHSDTIFMAGSCFSGNISEKLSEAKFRVNANPTGILFNPASISEMLWNMAEGRRFKHEDLLRDRDLYFSWSHHSSFSGTDPKTVLDNINTAAREGAKTLSETSHVILTFGTAWIYCLADSGTIVANCHKQPPTSFRRERLSVNDIVSSYSRLLDGPLKGKTVIFTISPVRHLKDGFAENSLSKAILRTAVGELVETKSNALYFPAYEIVQDDLRDYRFYGDDMLHPSSQAVNYIWEKFCGWAFAPSTFALLPRIDAIRRAVAHRPMRPGSESHKKFADKMVAELNALRKLMPGIDFTEELHKFTSKEP